MEQNERVDDCLIAKKLNETFIGIFSNSVFHNLS